MPKVFTPPALRVRILAYQETDRTLSYVLEPIEGGTIGPAMER